MPYTPPTSHSPIASRSETPLISRSNSYSKGQGHDNNRGNERPDLPRSSSAAYLQKSRRSPTAVKPDTSFPDSPPINQLPGNTSVSDQKPELAKSYCDGSVQDSADLMDSITTRKAEIEFAEHSPMSSDEEVHTKRGRRRELENLAELQAAIMIIEQRRESSPNRMIEATKKAKMALGLIVPLQASSHSSTGAGSTHPPLSNGARKVSHSRSATESSAILDYTRNYDSPGRSTTDSECEEEDANTMRRKPAMVRKKSGELVRPALRPASAKRRPSSMPGTPTYSKAVHFNQELEQVRHFLQVDRPLAVSAGSSPVESYESEIEFPFSDDFTSRTPYEWEIRLSNFHRETVERLSAPVRVERVYLTPDTKTLMGAVAVANVAFHKLVVARFTLDYWKTTSEIVADFNNDVRRKQTNDGYDRFTFSIKLEDQANLESKTMFFCIRYSVNGQEFWDNNKGVNYQVDFSKKAKPQKGKQGMQATGSRPLPRSKPSPPASIVRNMPSFDDFAKYDLDSFRQPAASFLGDAPIRLKSPKQSDNFLANSPALRTKPPTQAFGNRYDFGASLSAAMQAANEKLGDRSGLPPAKQAPAKKPSFAKQDFVGPSASTRSSGQEPPKHATSQKAVNNAGASESANVKPAALTAEKPSLQSTSYHELIDRYCFFGSAKGSPQIGKAAGRVPTDGAFDDSPESDYGFDKASRSQSPSPPACDSPPPKERKPAPQSTSQYNSRSASPATGLIARAASPDIYGYPYHQTLQNSFLNESHAPTAILG